MWDGSTSLLLIQSIDYSLMIYQFEAHYRTLKLIHTKCINSLHFSYDDVTWLTTLQV